MCHLDLVQAIFDALGNLDLALARQQLDRAHLPHVHAHRIGRTAEFCVDAGQRRFGFLSGVVIVRDGGVRQQQRFGVGRLLMDGNAHVVDHVDDILDLLGIDDVVRQVIVHFRVGQITLFLAAGNQVF